MIVPLVRSLLPGDCLSGGFVSALESVDSGSFCSSLGLRKPLARLVVAHPELLRRNFTRHSVAELATSETLGGVAATMKPVALRDELLSHAGDELRHAKLFNALALTLTHVGERADSENYDWILENDRRFLESYDGDIVEFVCSVLAGELRTYSFLEGYLEALEGSNLENSARIAKVLRRILEDECRHIAYTARHVNHWMSEGLDLTDSLRSNFRAFDRNSWIEVEATARFLSERA